MSMKRLVIYGSLLSLAATIVWGFDPKVFRPNPPKRTFGEAYFIALRALGTETNDYYCIGAKIGISGVQILTRGNGFLHLIRIVLSIKPFTWQ
jgi:hypothetical protein